MTRKNKKDVYDIITERILALLDKGKIPWHKPWTDSFSIPRNLRSKKEYRGINIWLLQAMGYESPFWLTYKQATEMGGQVRKGEKGCPVVYWNWIEKETGELEEDGTKKIRRVGFIRYYTVFNTQQIDGIEDKVPDYKGEEKVFNPIKRAEGLVEDIPEPRIKWDEQGGHRAYYRPALDKVHMPRRTCFNDEGHWYATLFHEFVHATGHASRLNRKTLVENDGFGGYNYSQEELVAEFGSAFLCGLVGIEKPLIENAAGYIQNWKKEIKDDPKLVIHAASAAQKATDWLTKKWHELEKEEDVEEMEAA